MTRLILIRHGETDFNLQNRYCGFSDPPLNSKGIEQSEKLAAELEAIGVDKVYASDLKRAYETAAIIFKGNSIEKTENFREMNFGIFEGLKYEEIVQRYSKFYRDWIDNPLKVQIPKGEGVRDLSKRVKGRLYSIISRYKDRTIAVVTHGGPIRVILCDALKYGLDMFWQIEQNIGALNIIEYSKKLEPHIVKVNDTSPLSIKEGSLL